eukprot:GHVO01056988.1.p1 GENE.GHVO01056988.1~~GHVO01056988.1.p1  ORF type:complete len:193 (+),score=58.42 GHVO01056988.1:245-823(+)
MTMFDVEFPSTDDDDGMVGTTYRHLPYPHLSPTPSVEEVDPFPSVGSRTAHPYTLGVGPSSESDEDLVHVDAPSTPPVVRKRNRPSHYQRPSILHDPIPTRNPSPIITPRNPIIARQRSLTEQEQREALEDLEEIRKGGGLPSSDDDIQYRNPRFPKFWERLQHEWTWGKDVKYIDRSKPLKHGFLRDEDET